MVTAPAIDLRKPSAEKSRLSCPMGIRSTGLREEPSGTLQCVTAGTTFPSDFAPCLPPRPCASGFLNMTDYLNNSARHIFLLFFQRFFTCSPGILPHLSLQFQKWDSSPYTPYLLKFFRAIIKHS